MVNALWITLIGMGLVFLAILLLWGLMALLVRLTAEKEVAAAPAQTVDEAVVATQAPEGVDQDSRQHARRAAAAATAVAIALSLQTASTAARKPAGSLSPWQLAHRAGRGRQRGR